MRAFDDPDAYYGHLALPVALKQGCQHSYSDSYDGSDSCTVFISATKYQLEGLLHGHCHLRRAICFEGESEQWP